MKRNALLSLMVLACSLAAQSNVVPGLDGRLTDIDDLDYYGRKGAAHPNGQAGMAMLNTMCNPGSVVIPWQAPMQPNHPMFGFIVVRVSGDRIHQISDWSYCKHAFTSVNVNGSCGTCENPGTGQLMGLNCSDTYGSGNNADRVYLGPPVEIDPWLGVWNPVGSYFDIGDPSQAGYPAPADGVRSLNQAVFSSDPVRNRVTINEQDLLTAGASYFYGLQLIHRGESLANRGDNLASRGFNPAWNGTSWSFPNNAAGQTYGSILQRWSGAEVNNGGNGNDDGRFFVANKVTPLGGGLYHYEYAVHNVDNHRGGATLRVPIDAGATASNFSFRDIDGNAGNNWTAARVGNEIVFTAPLSNPLNWNTIYNFGFDANFAPGSSSVALDQARVGPGALTVVVGAKAPSGSTFAQSTPVGTGCGSAPGCFGSFYENSFDLANSGYTIENTGSGYRLRSLQGSWIPPAGTTLTLGDDTGSSQALPFTLPFNGGSTTNLWICSNGFVAASGSSTSYQPSSTALLTGAPTWAALWRDLNPSTGGQVRFDANATRAVVTYNAVRNFGQTTTVTFQLQFYPSGTVHVIYQAVAGTPTTTVGWSRGGGAGDPGAIDISASIAAGPLALCTPEAGPTPAVSLSATNRPVLGTTVNLLTSNAPAGTLGGLMILSTNPVNPGADLSFLGMINCTLYVNLDLMGTFPIVGSSGTASWSIPNVPSASGLIVRAQSATLTPGGNAFGWWMANAVDLLLGLN